MERVYVFYISLRKKFIFESAIEQTLKTLYMPTKTRRKTSKAAKLRSHLTGQLAETQLRRRHQILNMDLDLGRMTLASETITRSFEDQADIFLQTFKKLKLKQRKLDNVLILGFGMGSVGNILKEKFKLTPEITAIEMNPLIIDISKKSVNPEVAEHLHLIQDDAYEYAMKETRRYDLICFDIYNDSFKEDRFKQLAFTEKLGQLMRSDAVLLYNTQNVNLKSEIQNKTYHKEVFSMLYPSSSSLESGANTIYIEDRHPFLGDA